jgi:prevent-host-death family protein
METLPLATAKAQLSALIDQVEDTHDRVLITRNGRPVAVLISPEELESLEETLEIISDPGLMRSIRRSEAEVARGEVVGEEELAEMLTNRRRARG